MSNPSDDQISLWHARIGHVAVAKLPHIGKVAILPDSFQSAISGAYPIPGICEPCLEGKQARQPYPATSNRPIEPLEVIHTDTCNIPVPSIKEYKDFVSFTDQATRISFIYYLADNAGSITALANSSGGIIGRYYYSPWGELVSQDAGLPTQPLLPAGQGLSR